MGESPGELSESDAEFRARLDRQVEQAHRGIAAVYERARRAAAGAEEAGPHTDWPRFS
jgi:uncharacterized phage protein gp47/JayE